MRDALRSAAEEAVVLARAAGADEAFATASRSREVDTRYRDGALEEVKDATSRAISLQLYVDGRYASHRTNDLRPDRLRTFIDEAVAITRALQPDPHRVITDPALYAGLSDADLDLVDPEVAGLGRDARIAFCEGQYAMIAGADRLISATSAVSDGHAVRAVASSNGFSGVHESTWLWMGSDVTLRDDGDARAEGYMWGGANHRGDVPGPEEIGAEALRRTQVRVGSRKGPTVRGTMVVDPSAAPSLIGRLLGPASAASVQRGQSFWAGKQGKRVLSERLTITDEPLLPRGLGSRKFDGEGIASRPLSIVRDGALETLYVDTYYGKKLGVAPTTGSASNRVVALGDQDLAALLRAAGSGVYVTSWLGGNADATTGDFSFGIRGHLIEGGQIGAPVGEMNVTGNLIDLFARLAAVGNDPWPYSSTRAPTLVFDGVQFSGV